MSDEVLQINILPPPKVDVHVNQQTQSLTQVVGIMGPAGQDGVSVTYTYLQDSPSNVWIVNHNLNKYPIVQVMTVGLQQVLANVQYTSLNQLRIHFNEPQQGVVIYQ